eukprot:gene5750-6942_t
MQTYELRKQRLWHIQKQLITIFLIKPASRHVLTVLLPRVRKWYQVHYGSGKETLESHARFTCHDQQAERPPMREINDLYSGRMIQLAYVLMFGSIFPLGAIMSTMNNWIEIRVDAQKVLNTQRVMPSGASGIGSWALVIEIVVYGSIFSNTLIVFFATNAAEDWGIRRGVEGVTAYILVQIMLLVLCLVVHKTLAPSISLHVIAKDKYLQWKLSRSNDESSDDEAGPEQPERMESGLLSAEEDSASDDEVQTLTAVNKVFPITELNENESSFENSQLGSIEADIAKQLRLLGCMGVGRDQDPARYRPRSEAYDQAAEDYASTTVLAARFQAFFEANDDIASFHHLCAVKGKPVACPDIISGFPAPSSLTELAGISPG